jgi:anion-transporting  ArsA/GET3 family ATPase
MEAGFRDRAGTVMALLRADSTRYVLVASPRRDTVIEASFFAEKLHQNGLSVAGVIVNRLHPAFGTGAAADAEAHAAAATDAGDDALAELWANLAELRRVAEDEAGALEPLRVHVGDAPFAKVRLLATDVHDVDGLTMIASQIFPHP